MKTVNFKYKNDYFYNVVAGILFFILIILAIVIFKYILDITYKILFILISFIFINIILVIISKTIEVTNGKFTFDKHSFIYETLNKEYTINYKEIEYISKNTYIDTHGFIRQENFLYKIKIKNAGYFLFRLADESLEDAINALSSKSEIIIDD